MAHAWAHATRIEGNRKLRWLFASPPSPISHLSHPHNSAHTASLFPLASLSAALQNHKLKNCCAHVNGYKLHTNFIRTRLLLLVLRNLTLQRRSAGHGCLSLARRVAISRSGCSSEFVLPRLMSCCCRCGLLHCAAAWRGAVVCCCCICCCGIRAAERSLGRC